MMKRLASLLLRATGWKPEGAKPAPPKYVLIAAPHTSNWDFVYLLAFALVFDVKMSFMAKEQLFRGPFGWFMRKVGGIPVHRDRSTNMVDAMVAVLDRHDELALVVPAEGNARTPDALEVGLLPHRVEGEAADRHELPRLLAQRSAASAPRSCRAATCGPTWMRSAPFYADKKGKFPELFSDVRLRDEEERDEEERDEEETPNA